jgi:predicted RNase H-like HicB family nuclease
MLIHGYSVVVERGRDGWGGWADGLPGLVVVAHTRQECIKLLEEAIPFHLEGMERQRGKHTEGWPSGKAASC